MLGVLRRSAIALSLWLKTMLDVIGAYCRKKQASLRLIPLLDTFCDYTSEEYAYIKPIREK